MQVGVLQGGREYYSRSGRFLPADPKTSPDAVADKEENWD